MYCSQLWRPCLIKDIIRIESVQRRSTKFILSYAPINYKDRLIQLQILPLMYMYEIQDILFLVKNFQSPQNLDILKFISFSTTNTRSGTKLKLRQKLTRTSTTRHSYFNQVVNLWNSLPTIDIYLTLSLIKQKLHDLFWDNFLTTFDPDNPCTYHYYCPCSQCVIWNLASRPSHT
jgi:hypothetical protein